jgi:AcrR family transcriptional regulator
MTAEKPELQWVRPPRQARSQETLDRILDAAEALVADKGFDDTPVSEIVLRAGSSVGAFYARFHDKQGLLNALYERFSEEALVTADVALDPQRWRGVTLPEIVRTALRFLVEIFSQRRGLMRAFVVRNHRHPELQARQQRLSQHVIERLSALVLARRHELSHPDPERAARFGLVMVLSSLESTLLFGEMRAAMLTLSDDTLAEELSRAYLAYLGVSPHTDEEPA